jgi:protocatechuate 3,4-dioxygenase beta subunit
MLFLSNTQRHQTRCVVQHLKNIENEKIFRILLLIFITISCKRQSNSNTEKNEGRPCQDCKVVLDFNLLNPKPKSTDTLPGFENNEPKIKTTGIA